MRLQTALYNKAAGQMEILPASAEIKPLAIKTVCCALHPEAVPPGSMMGWGNAAELSLTHTKLVAINQWCQPHQRLEAVNGTRWNLCQVPPPTSLLFVGWGSSCLSVRITSIRPHPPPAAPPGPDMGTVGKIQWVGGDYIIWREGTLKDTLHGIL